MFEAIDKILWYTLPFKSKKDLKDFLQKTNAKWFQDILFEKDFYLTVILHRISTAIPWINFKWWTCLNKVYFPYFRLSEDLDFSISIQDKQVNTNKKREQFAQNFRQKIKELTQMMWRLLNDDKFHHKKAQWNENLKKKEYTYLKYVVSYPSLYSEKLQTIKIELTYTSQQYFASIQKQIQSIFVDPVTDENIFQDKTIQCLDLKEMMSEKVRAALTRKKPAIRDFFDIRHVKNQWFDFEKIQEVIVYKIEESEGWYTIQDHYPTLQEQIKSDLEPVLWKEYSDFDFDTIYNFVLSFKN